jgi:hypothetical protein
MITKKRFMQIIQSASEAWRKERKELLSCFDSERLWEVLHAHIDLEPDFGLTEFSRSLEFGEPNKRAIMSAVISESGPDQELLLENAIELALDRAFLTLFDRGALKKLLVVDEENLPARAQRDMDRVVANVEAAAPKAPVAPVAPPPPPADPVDVCVREFHELGSSAFAKKYLANTDNRHYYEMAIEAGRI